MRFGMMFANVGPASDGAYAGELGRIAEAAGIESLWAVEHVVVPSGYESRYPYSRSGRMPGGEDFPIPDPLVWSSWVAASTDTLKLATGVVILPQRHPLVTAKEVATLDRLSGGRTMLGVGVGWLREEFEALGVPFERRGRRVDEYVDVIRRLWEEDETAYDGEFVSFPPVKSFPKPVQPRVPVVVGGHSDAAARRAGRLGDGFFPARGRPERLEELFGVARAAAADAGRDPDALELTAGGATYPEAIRRLEDLGVDRVVISPPGFDRDSLRDELDRFADDVVSRYA